MILVKLLNTNCKIQIKAQPHNCVVVCT